MTLANGTGKLLLIISLHPAADVSVLGWCDVASEQERVFYKLLCDRKKARINELSRLSPKRVYRSLSVGSSNPKEASSSGLQPLPSGVQPVSSLDRIQSDPNGSCIGIADDTSSINATTSSPDANLQSTTIPRRSYWLSFSHAITACFPHLASLISIHAIATSFAVAKPANDSYSSLTHSRFSSCLCAISSNHAGWCFPISECSTFVALPAFISDFFVSTFLTCASIYHQHVTTYVT